MHARAVVVGGGAVAVLVAVAAGGCTGTPSSAAPPLIVCGTQLSSSPAGPVMEDASGGRSITVGNLTVGEAIFLKVSSDCARGASLSLPASAATGVASAKTADGHTAAIVLQPHVRTFDIAVAPADGDAYEVLVRLDRDTRFS